MNNPVSKQPSVPSKPMRDAMLMAIYEGMKKDPEIFFVTADFGSPILDKLRADFPNKFINVGIAEQNLINVSTGLALEGYKVFAYAIAPFITMRCYEQIRVNLAILSQVRSVNVTLIGVGAGYSYVVSGPTHQCFEDLSVMRALPSLDIFSPADHVVAAALFEQCINSQKPKYLRLDAQVLPVLYETVPDMQLGYHVQRRGKKACVIATGYMVHTALKVADNLQLAGIDVSVIDLFSITSFAEDHLAETLKEYERVITMEEGFRGRGGLDAMIFDFSVRHQLNFKMCNIGVKPGYRFELGTRADLHEQIEIGIESVTKRLIHFLQQ